MKASTSVVRLSALVIGSALVASACSGSSSTPRSTSSTRNTNPLTIGLTYLDNTQSSSSLGASKEHVTNEDATLAFVRAINATGGVNGRHLTVISYKFNAQDPNYSTAASAACAKFTQDNHVSVVLDEAFGLTGGFRDCLQKAGVFDITQQQEGDDVSTRQASLHVNVSAMTLDRTYSAVLQQSADDGYLTTSNRLGVVLEGCPENLRAYSQTIVPLIGKLGLATPKKIQLGCTTGFASAGAAAQALSSALLTFRQAGVDRIMFMSYYESVLLLLFAPGASSQHYTPGYLLSSLAQPAALMTEIPKTQWPQMHGVGNAPFNDVNNPTPTAVDSRCLQLAQTGGAAASTALDRDLVVSACAPFLMLEAALAKTGGNTDAQQLASAVASLGSSFADPGQIDGKSEFSADRHDGPALVRAFAFQAGCQCIQYVGQPQPAP